FHPQHVNQFVQVGFQPARAKLIGLNHDAHARDAVLVGMPDRQRLDVETTPPEERRHPVEHPRLVFHVGHKCVRHAASGYHWISVGVTASTGLGRRIIACRSAPAGTIGNTVSSCSTWNSITTPPRWLRAALTVGTTSFRLVTVMPVRPNASASFAKFGFTSGV